MDFYFAPYEWDAKNAAMFAASNAALVGDYLQTRHIAKNPDQFREINPILGPHPSVHDVNKHFLASALLNYLVANNLSPKNRNLWLAGVGILEGAFVGRNIQTGIKFDF